ncbi:MAG: hypothetical protein Cons2KO_30070 [Congregibacter sp.]
MPQQRLLLTLFVGLLGLNTWQGVTAQNRSLAPLIETGRASISAGSNQERLKEGDAVFVNAEGSILKLKVEYLRISAHGNQLLRAGSKTARMQLVASDLSLWSGRLSVEDRVYRVTGGLDSLRATLLPPSDHRPDRVVPRVHAGRQSMRGAEDRVIAPQSDASYISPTIIDVLIIREEEVDPAYIDLSLLFANDAFFTSDVPIQLRVVAEEVVPKQNGTLEDILDRAIFGQEDLDLPLPAAYGADIAGVFVDSDEDDDTCGIANLGVYRFEGEVFLDPWLYSTTDVKCPEDVFAHEVGHNLGAAHDRENVEDDSFVAFPYAYAHRIGPYGTIMSYAPFLHPLFANPAIEECGASFNQPCGVAESEEAPSDIAKLFRLSAPAVTLIGDPFEQGVETQIIGGASCRPRFPAGDNSVQWRERGIINAGVPNSDVLQSVEFICPLKRKALTANQDIDTMGDGFYVSVTLSDELGPRVEYPCTLSETIGDTVVYEYEISPVLGREPDVPYTLSFPRVTPRDPLLSSYTLSCDLSPGSAINHITLSTTRPGVTL